MELHWLSYAQMSFSGVLEAFLGVSGCFRKFQRRFRELHLIPPKVLSGILPLVSSQILPMISTSISSVFNHFFLSIRHSVSVFDFCLSF